MRRPRSLVLGAVLLALAIFVGACGSGEDDGDTGGGGGGGDKPTLKVGAVAFAENQIVAEMYAQVLENAGYTVERELDLGARDVLYPAVQNGEIDLAPEYLGSLLLFLDENAKASGDPDNNLSLAQPLLEEDGLELLEPSEANDQNAFVVTSETSEKLGVTSVSDLSGEAGDLTLGGPPECPDRPFCLIGLKETYGVEFGEFKPLDLAGPLTVAALEGGKIDVALLFSTQSVIADKGWVLLEDDKALQTAENITPLVGEAVDDEARGLLNEISALLTTENITELNGRVEIDQETPEAVAQSFLEDNGLLD
jgi:osmoprotectant transport system substrate-binding protein